MTLKVKKSILLGTKVDNEIVRELLQLIAALTGYLDLKAVYKIIR